VAALLFGRWLKEKRIYNKKLLALHMVPSMSKGKERGVSSENVGRNHCCGLFWRPPVAVACKRKGERNFSLLRRAYAARDFTLWGNLWPALV